MVSALLHILSIFVTFTFATQLLKSPRKWKKFGNEFVWEPQAPPCRHPDKFEPNWIIQYSDHFSHLDPNVWRQRYFVNLDHFEMGGPMYVIIGGPWAISPHFVCSGLVVDVAKNFRGVVFYLEHRFYGQSQPARYAIV